MDKTRAENSRRSLESDSCKSAFLSVPILLVMLSSLKCFDNILYNKKITYQVIIEVLQAILHIFKMIFKILLNTSFL